MEILYQYTGIAQTPGWKLVTILSVCSFLVWVGIVIADKIILDKKYDQGTGLFAAVILAIILLMGAFSLTIGKGEPYNIYKVTLDENTIDYVSFLDQYEIIDQEGKIYTVKNRN